MDRDGPRDFKSSGFRRDDRDFPPTRRGDRDGPRREDRDGPRKDNRDGPRRDDRDLPKRDAERRLPPKKDEKPRDSDGDDWQTAKR